MKILPAFTTALLLIAFAGCSSDGGPGPGADGSVVGAPCRSHSHCFERCERDVCTVACRSDHDCPMGTYCVDDRGGICGLACRFDADCLSAEHRCQSRNRRGAPGRVDVCRRR